MDRKQKMKGALFEVIEELNRLLPPEEQLQKGAQTKLADKEEGLDSLGLIILIVMVEEKVEQAFGLQVSLSNLELLEGEDNPFVTVDSLSAYLSTMLEEK
jgi:acyl carrier protein